MKIICAVLMLLGLVIRAGAQNANPQPTFSSSVFSASPSLYLNFNDATITFKDQISQLNFGGEEAANFGHIPATPEAFGPGQVAVSAVPLAAGMLTSFQIQFQNAPTAGQSLTIGIFTNNGSDNLTATASFTVSVAATTAVQTFTAPANFTAVPVSSGQLIGFWAISGTAEPFNGTNNLGAFFLNNQSSFPSGPKTYTSNTAAGYALIATISQTSPGTVTPRQPGFDSTQPNNTSAAFAYNAWNAAPNNTLGDIEWNAPWTMLLQVDRLNWNRTGTLVLASKGDIGSVGNSYWELYLQMDGENSQLCFTANGDGTPSTSGAAGNVTKSICTNGATLDAMPNGFNYNLIVENAGTGAAFSMYINGLQVGTYLAGAPANGGFGGVSLNASGGTGYANSTAFSSHGGGPNCVVTGTMNSSGGVPLSSNGFSFTNNDGCTSAPTITLTSPTGTGVTISVGLEGQLMNSTNYPVMVPGYVSGGIYYGVAGTTNTQTSTSVDEFAIFPGILTSGQIGNLFYETKFHEMLLNPVTTPPVLVFDDDGCADMDNQFALQLSIALHQYGVLNLAGVVAEDPSATCAALWRQMLDQAGLNNVPLSVPTTFTAGNSGAAEPAANTISYNASTPLSNADWEPAVTMYRTIFAKHPATPIDIVSGAGMTAIAEFMQSPADSISSMTGLQLMAQNATNGGAIYALGGGCTASAPPATTPCTGEIGGNLSQDYPSAQYVLSHNGTLPIYWIGGNPQSAGPGVLSTRTSNDPMFLATTSFGTDVRQCFDCLAVEAAVSKYFYGGVQIAFSGGTGYANSTPFALSGGGPNCQGAGFMTATGGVPNGIEFNWGASAVGSSSGIGSGCTSAPTVNLIGATGTGVTLTAYPELVCGTDTVSETGSTAVDSFTSAACSNHFVSPGSFNANQTPTSGALMEWFINSLVDPPPNGQARAY
jgi:hypothetical protein